MKPIILCILDGVGIRDEEHGNAVKMAKMPNFNMLLSKYPNSTLEASGNVVGLPQGQMGNSEVGHMNIGAGRIVYQPLERINHEIEIGSFFKNEILLKSMKRAKKKRSKVHVLGLLSDGGIHSHINHLYAILDMCKVEELENVYLHLFLDGRDTFRDSSKKYIKDLKEKLKGFSNAKIATISGRYYAMDRDNRWDRVQEAYHVLIDGCHKIENIDAYIDESYEKEIYDEFIIPATLDDKGIIEDGDEIIVFNYRPDRLRELFSSLSNPHFNAFPHKELHNINVVTMMPVSEEVISTPAFELLEIKNTFGQIISSNHLKQLRIAETEKYAHVTYFFDGGQELELEGSKRILIPSPSVATYDLSPDMSAIPITKTLLKELDKGLYDIIILNYANGDMLGHTGNLEKTIKSLETLDDCIGKLYNKVQEKEGIMIITADHGNSEMMLDEEEHIVTSHTTSRVPFIVTKSNLSLKDGKIGDIAPTILELLNIEKPEEMTGESLIVHEM